MPIAGTEYKNLKPKEALAFFREKKIRGTRAWDDLVRAEHDRAFVVAGAVRDSLLADFKNSVEKALEEGATLAEFRRDFDKIVRKHGWSYKGSRGWRSAVIYRTNLRTAYAAGRYRQMTDPDVLGERPYWMYAHGDSANPRAEHLAWDGLVLPASDPWWRTHYPPNGWGCSCSVLAVGEEEAKRRGTSFEAPPQKTRTYERVDRKTGEITKMRVPEGVSPGWDYAPGESWLRSQTPEWMDEWPVPGKNPRPPQENLTAVVELPAESILPTGQSPEYYVEAFLSRFGIGNIDGEKVVRLPHGPAVPINKQFFLKRTGEKAEWKIGPGARGGYRKRGRYVRILAEVILNPDEIWVGWDERQPGVFNLTTRLVGKYRVGNQEHAVGAIWEYSAGRWHATTAFRMGDHSLNNRRIGKLVYKRRE